MLNKDPSLRKARPTLHASSLYEWQYKKRRECALSPELPNVGSVGEFAHKGPRAVARRHATQSAAAAAAASAAATTAAAAKTAAKASAR